MRSNHIGHAVLGRKRACMTSLPPVSLQAMLWRQWLLKKRSPTSTLVEVLSPIVLISMLVITYYPHRQQSLQAQNGVTLPPPCILTGVGTTQSGQRESEEDKAKHTQVVAYLEVTPEVMPAKIYVNETAQVLQGLIEPWSEATHQPLTTKCSDLLSRVALAGAAGRAWRQWKSF